MLRAHSSLCGYSPDDAGDKGYTAKTGILKNCSPILLCMTVRPLPFPVSNQLIYTEIFQKGVKEEFITVPGGLNGKFDKKKNAKINKGLTSLLQLDLSYVVISISVLLY